MREKVINVGKNPSRKEGDIDSKGRPTNTQYDPAQEPPPKRADKAQKGAPRRAAK